MVVLGVLVALGAQQIVEDWHWRAEVRDGRQTFSRDVYTILTNADERGAEDRCIRRRLIYLQNLLAQKPGYLPELGHIGSPPARPWYAASWDSLVASNVSTHLKPEELLAFGDLAHNARRADDVVEREIADWTILFTMVGPARKLADGEEAQIRRAMTDAAFQLNRMRLISAQLRQAALDTKLLTEQDVVTARADLSDALRGPNARHICGPVLPADAGRVDAPYDPAVQTRASAPTVVPADGPALPAAS